MGGTQGPSREQPEKKFLQRSVAMAGTNVSSSAEMYNYRWFRALKTGLPCVGRDSAMEDREIFPMSFWGDQSQKARLPAGVKTRSEARKSLVPCDLLLISPAAICHAGTPEPTAFLAGHLQNRSSYGWQPLAVLPFVQISAEQRQTPHRSCQASPHRQPPLLGEMGSCLINTCETLWGE